MVSGVSCYDESLRQYLGLISSSELMCLVLDLQQSEYEIRHRIHPGLFLKAVNIFPSNFPMLSFPYRTLHSQVYSELYLKHDINTYEHCSH